MHIDSKVLIYLKLFMTAVFWGGTFIAGRIVAKNVGPFSAAFLRFSIASAILFFIILRMEGQLPFIKRRQILPVIILGMTGMFSYNVFFFKGLESVTAGRAAVIVTTNPIFICVFSWIFFNERLNGVKVFGIMVSVAGAVFVVSKGNLSELLDGAVGRGEFFIFLCVLSWSIYSLVGKAVMTDLSPIVSVFYSCLAGSAALSVPAYFEGIGQDIVHMSEQDWLGIVYLGVFGTVLGVLWYYEGIDAIGPTKASQFINFVPVSAVVFGFLLLGEDVTRSLLIGGILVTVGVYMTNSSVGRKPTVLSREKN